MGRDEAMRETSGFGNAVKRRVAMKHIPPVVSEPESMLGSKITPFFSRPSYQKKKKERKKERSDDSVVW